MNANEPAYPQVKTEWPNSNYHNTFSVGGLTKREHAAIEMMKAIVANPNYDPPRRNRFDVMATDAIAAADALLAQLTKEPT